MSQQQVYGQLSLSRHRPPRGAPPEQEQALQRGQHEMLATITGNSSALPAFRLLPAGRPDLPRHDCPRTLQISVRQHATPPGTHRTARPTRGAVFGGEVERRCLNCQAMPFASTFVGLRAISSILGVLSLSWYTNVVHIHGHPRHGCNAGNRSHSIRPPPAGPL
jgi:hypothetical protein